MSTGFFHHELRYEIQQYINLIQKDEETPAKDISFVTDRRNL